MLHERMDRSLVTFQRQSTMTKSFYDKQRVGIHYFLHATQLTNKVKGSLETLTMPLRWERRDQSPHWSFPHS